MKAPSIRAVAVSVLVLSLALLSCQLPNASRPSEPPDTTAPTTLTSMAPGPYGECFAVTLTSNEPATIYYTTDGTVPVVGQKTTSSHSTPVTLPMLTEGTTTVTFFGVDASGNKESPKSATYSVDLSAPIVCILSPKPSPLGLLSESTIEWSSSKAGSFQLEFGGTGVVGSGAVLAKGTTLSASVNSQTVHGYQLEFGTPLMFTIFVTDKFGHIGSISEQFELKPLTLIGSENGSGDVMILPSGNRAYVSFPGSNTVDSVTIDPEGVDDNTRASSFFAFSPWQMRATPDNSRIYVTNGTYGDSMIATATDTTTASISSPMIQSPTGIAITPDGNRAYGLSNANLVYELCTDPQSAEYNQVIGYVPCSRLLLAGSISITPDGKRAVVDWQGMIAQGLDIIDIDPSSSSFNTIIASPGPIITGNNTDTAISSDGQYAYSVYGGSLCRVDLKSYSLASSGTLYSRNFCLTPDNSTILTQISAGGSGVAILSVVNASDFSVLGEVPLGSISGVVQSIAITPDGNRAYLSVSGNPLIVLPLQ